jgi:hypothetical protein
MSDPRTRAIELLSMKIRPLLSGIPPEVQGGVLADLVSVFIVGHHPHLREAMLEMHVDLVRELIPETEKELFPHGLAHKKRGPRPMAKGESL